MREVRAKFDYLTIDSVDLIHNYLFERVAVSLINFDIKTENEDHHNSLILNNS